VDCGFARWQGDQVSGLVGGEVHGPADGVAVIPGGEPVRDLDGGVLDYVGDQLGRDLLGDDQGLAVGADLGEQVGEHLDRLRRRSVAGAGRWLAQQPVGFLDHGQVPQPDRSGWLGAGAEP
jgi:hypothetical protein